MLFNFPKEEILKFYQKIFGPIDGTMTKKQNMNFCSELYESTYNFNIKSHVQGNFEENNIEEYKVEKSSQNSVIDEVPPKSRKASHVLDVSILGAVNMSQISVSGISNNDLPNGVLRNKRRKSSFIEKIKKQKVMPTNVGNQIAIWCDSIYLQYGQDDRLYFKDFVAWAEIHKNFIFTFARYFRYTMWQSFRNPITNKEYLGFHNLVPVLQEDFQIKFDTEKAYKSALGCLYIEFLFIWYDKTKTVPNKIKILKDCNIIFTDKENQIQIEHFSTEYHNFSIKLNQVAIYLYWKEILTLFSR